jgi:hypothetical protein
MIQWPVAFLLRAARLLRQSRRTREVAKRLAMGRAGAAATRSRNQLILNNDFFKRAGLVLWFESPLTKRKVSAAT